MADELDVKKWEELRREEEKAVNDAERIKNIALDIANKRLKKEAIVKDANDTLIRSIKGTEVSNLDRAFRALGALDTGNASKVTSDWLKQQPLSSGKSLNNPLAPGRTEGDDFSLIIKQAQVFVKQYASDVQKELLTVKTGIEQRDKPRATYSDQFGGGVKGGVAGFVADVALSPTSYMGSTISKMLSGTKEIIRSVGQEAAAASPKIQKMFDAVGRSMDIFYDVNKNPSLKNRGSLDEVFRKVANSTDKGRYAQLAQFGRPRTTGSIQNLVNLGWGQVDLPGLEKILFQPEYQKLFTQAFIKNQEKQTGAAGLWMKGQSIFKQAITGVNPMFHARNFLDETSKNLFWQPQSAKELWQNLKGYPQWFKAKRDPAQLAEAAALGITKQPGMIGNSLQGNAFTRLISSISTWVEEWGRGPLYMAEKGRGKGSSLAAKESERVHFQYNQAYSTDAMNKADWIDIWRKYTVGLIQYAPGAIFDNLPKLSVAAKLYEDTKPDVYKTQPWLKPKFDDNKLAIGGVTASVSSVGDAFDLVTGGIKKWISHINPLVKATGEILGDWNNFKEKKVSKDTDGGQYKNANIVVQKLVGYDQMTGKVDPIKKYFAELLGGPTLSNYLTAVDPNKPLSNIINPFKDHSYSSMQLASMYAMNVANGGSAGPMNQGGGGLLWGAQRQDILRNEQDLAFQKKYNVGAGVYSNVRMKDEDGSYLHSANQKAGKEIADMIRLASPDIGKGMAEGFSAQRAVAAKDFIFEGTDPRLVKQWFESRAAMEKTLAPRLKGSPAMFNKGNMIYRTPVGTGPDAMVNAYKDAQKEQVSIGSKLAEILKAAQGHSYASVQQEAASAMHAMEQARASGLFQWSQKDIENYTQAISARMQKQMDDVTIKINKAIAETYDNWADSEYDGLNKIEIQRQVAIQKWMTSESYLVLQRNNKTKEMEDGRLSIEAKYAKLRQDRLASEARVRAETISNNLKDELTAIQAALKAAYDKGGLSTGAYYGALRKDAGQTYTGIGATTASAFLAAINPKSMTKNIPGVPSVSLEDTTESFTPERMAELKAQVMVAAGTIADTTELAKKIQEILPKSVQFDLHMTPGTQKGTGVGSGVGSIQKHLDMLKDEPSITEQIRILEGVYQSMTELVGMEGIGDLNELGPRMKAFSDAMTSLKKMADDLERGETDAKRAVGMANDTMDKLIGASQKNAWTNRPMSVLGTKYSGNALGWKHYLQPGQSPDLPAGYNADEEAFKGQKEAYDAETARQISAYDAKVKGAAFSNIGDSGIDGNATTYLKKIEDETTAHFNNMAALTEEGQGKVSRIYAYQINRQKEWNNLSIANDEKTFQKRLTVATDMSTMIGKTADILYSMSSNKSREMFYLMKSAALAEAVIKGAQTVMGAFKTGSDVAGPTLGYAYAGIAQAFVAAQVAQIMSAMFSGPTGKAQGGPIEGGSGTKDDVPFWGMGGEYVVKKKAVAKYGLNFMEAINQGLLELHSYDMPSLQISGGGTHYGEGGAIASRSEPQTATFILKNESGVPLKSRDGGTKQDGKEQVRTIIFDLMDKDPSFISLMRGR